MNKGRHSAVYDLGLAEKNPPLLRKHSIRKPEEEENTPLVNLIVSGVKGVEQH